MPVRLKYKASEVRFSYKSVVTRSAIVWADPGNPERTRADPIESRGAD